MQLLEVAGFRNIQYMRINPDPHLNIIVGGNAAGKTSILEAIYFLSRVRSFRTQQLNHLVNWENKSCHVFAKRDNDRMGVSRENSINTIRFNGKNLTGRTVLAERLPVQLINTEHQRLLLDGPKVRRQFLDWGVFHLDNNHRKTALRFNEALRQRNSALRSNNSRVAAAWIPILASSAAKLDRARREFINSIQPIWSELTSLWLGLDNLQLNYRGSAPAYEDWIGFFNDYGQRDIELGYTGRGPHRADLRLSMNKTPAAEVLSRGQQKLLVVALLISEVQLWSKKGLIPLLLIDDLAAELDPKHLGCVMRSVSSSNAQTFLTVIDTSPLPKQGEQGSWFTIASGSLQPML